MLTNQYPAASLKLRYPLVMRVSLVITLLGFIGVMVMFPKMSERGVIKQEVRIEITTQDVPQTEQKIERAAPPSRPSIPIESEDIDFTQEIEWEMPNFDDYVAFDAPPPPPEEDDGPRFKFIPYDEPPEPIGGFAAIQRNVIYPEIAQEAGIEGTVVVQAFVNKSGIVTECIVLKGVPNTGLDEAAIAAIKKTKFRPAKQRDRAVGVYISIPVIFKLRSN